MLKVHDAHLDQGSSDVYGYLVGGKNAAHWKIFTVAIYQSKST